MWALGLLAVLAVGIWVVVLFNGLIRLRNTGDNAWSDVDVHLKKRHDLVPNLVETVKGYARHEQETLERVVRARNQAIDAASTAAKATAETALTESLRGLFALAESYPDLKANEGFLGLQRDLSRDRGRHRERAPLLQRGGARLQHQAGSLSLEPPRWPPRLPNPLFLPGRSLRARGRERAALNVARISLLFVAGFPDRGRAGARASQIDEFDVSILLDPDGTLFVTETIQVDFGDQQKHGIFRTIPVSYARTETVAGLAVGTTYSIRLRVLGVEDGAGAIPSLHDLARRPEPLDPDRRPRPDGDGKADVQDHVPRAARHQLVRSARRAVLERDGNGVGLAHPPDRTCESTFPSKFAPRSCAQDVHRASSGSQTTVATERVSPRRTKRRWLASAGRGP